MDNMFDAGNNNVGIDPTTIDTIDSLDAIPPADKKFEEKMKGSTPDPDKKPNDSLKKIVFLIVIILLMAGVSFGVYYYLSIANSKKKGGKDVNKPIVINERKVVIGTDISKYLNDNFKNCQFENTNFDSSKIGTYPLNMTCGNMKYEGKITVEEISKKNIATKFIVTYLNSEVKPDFFVRSSSSYSYAFIDAKVLKENLAVPNNIYPVEINFSGEGVNDIVVAILFVTEKKASQYLNCLKANENYFFTIDENQNAFGPAIYTKEVIYDEQSFYNNILNIKNGKLAYEENADYYVNYSEVSYAIEYNRVITKDELDKEEFPTSASQIEEHYISKGFNCTRSN